MRQQRDRQLPVTPPGVLPLTPEQAQTSHLMKRVADPLCYYNHPAAQTVLQASLTFLASLNGGVPRTVTPDVLDTIGRSRPIKVLRIEARASRRARRVA
jgi:hypothetical protein